MLHQACNVDFMLSAVVPFPLEFVRVRLGTQVRTVPKGVVRHVTVVVLVMKTLAYVLVLMASKASLAAQLQSATALIVGCMESAMRTIARRTAIVSKDMSAISAI